jgi:TonB family protein
MTRKVLAAALALSPMLLHAQANTPAQPLQAKLGQPMELAAAANSARNATPGTVRISTGVVAPKLIHTVDITTDNDKIWQANPASRKVVVSMVVDEAGKPTDLKIVQSVGANLDRNVLTAVSQYRFTPGTVSNEAVASPVNLEIELLAPSR